jgi:hypothetical protein
MKLCPYCGKAIVKQALACKYCGEWLEDISGYLEKKGSVYAHTDSIIVPPPGKLSKDTNKLKSEKKVSCVFCENSVILDEKETEEKVFVCKECGKKNIVTNGNFKNAYGSVPIGWGWILLIGYFSIAIQKYLGTLDDTLQVVITFSLSIFILLLIYFFIRRVILESRYKKKKFFGKIYDASFISGAVSTVGVVLFVFLLHIIYPYTGLQSDKKETDSKIMYYNFQISKISEKQSEIDDIISKPIYREEEALKNVNFLDDYISLNNKEKNYVDSMYKALEESDYYSGKKENKKRVKEANILINKIIVYKIMSARNLKNYYLSGDKNAFKTVEEINIEIAKLNKEYSQKFKELMSEE